MYNSAKCLKCSATMEEGFIVDNTHGGRMVSSWIAGAPEKSFWTGVKIRGKRKMAIKAMRCTACGFVEQYAK